MTNKQEFIYDALNTRVNSFSDEEKCNCLNLYYENNIDYIERIIDSNQVSSVSELVDVDYNNISVIAFNNNDAIDQDKIDEVVNECNAYFDEDYSDGTMYLYSFDTDINHYDRLDFLEDVEEDIDEEEELEF